MLGTATKLATPRKIAVSGAVSGSANFDGSGNITITTTQANIAVLTGTMTLEANENGEQWDTTTNTTEKKLDFPTGFTKDNCIVLAIGIRNNASANTLGYVYGSSDTHDVFITGEGFFPARVIVGEPNKLRLCVDNFYSSSPTIAYKIVLMKVL